MSGESARDRRIAEILDNLRRVFNVVHQYSKRAEKVGGLTGPQLWAMKILAESAPIRVTDLARRMYLHASTVVGILDRLEQKGYLTRNRSDADHRVVVIDLTREGREKIADVPQVAQGMLLRGLTELPPEGLERVAGGLQLLVGILGAEGIPPRLLFSSEVNVPDRDRSGGGDPDDFLP